MSNYLTYPFKNMKITQSYTGSYTHNPHSKGSPKDYPWDEAGKDTGREGLYCPCDAMKIVRIYTSGANTIWLESVNKVDFPDGSRDYASGMATHPNDSDIKKLKVGQIFHRGDLICNEGTDGNATGNHLHLSFGKGKILGNGWTKNNKGKWVLTTTGGAMKPEKMFYLDKSFTKVIQNKGIKFKELPAETPTKIPTKFTEEKEEVVYKVGNYKVTGANVLRVRRGPGTQYDALSFKNLSKSAQLKVLAKAKYKADGYVKGMTFTVKEVRGGWGATPSGWVSLEYCTKI